MWFQVNKCSSNSHHVHITDGRYWLHYSPAFVLYVAQFVLFPSKTEFFIVVMFLGKICFDSILIVDAIAIISSGGLLQCF